jgi:uncharacterized protein YyaL (SSP411 family)
MLRNSEAIMTATRPPNRLIHETSPYLLQHAHNPVDWYPWGEEALEKARREDKPILLSIGYSACHWCHVMAHESFEDEAVARVMNAYFINIKVDREERPDLDRIYQMAHQLLTQRPGGWPLTVFLAPEDLMPFFAGTYFPRTARHGMPGFIEVLEAIARVWRERREDIRNQNAQLRDIFAALEPQQGGGRRTALPAAAAVLDRAFAELERLYDPRHGGFGAAPKFPHPTSLELLLRHHARRRAPAALEMLRHTLYAMARGGIYDQLGGGFCRYSVDERWEIPHFEKMLYDNAQLLALYADAHAATGEPLFARIALQTAEWALREMRSPEGGFFSALDADSEGHEGQFYLWSREEIRTVLGGDDEAWRVAEYVFGLDEGPNFEERYHLHVRRTPAEAAAALGLPEAELEARLAHIREKLFAARARRVRPGRDEKILTAWNALMIKGLARAGRRLARAELVEAALQALDFLRATVWRDGRLAATYKDGRARLNAYLDDYAFLLDATLEVMQARFRPADLGLALGLAEALLEHFEDKTAGGFYFTSNDHERLAMRPKPLADEAIPAGNGVAAAALGRLGHLLGETRYLEAAERTLHAAARVLAEYPSGHGALAIALEEYHDPPQTVLVRAREPQLSEWPAQLARRYAPRRLVFAIDSDCPAADLPAALAARAPQGEAVAYVCTGHSCSPPFTRLEALEAALAQAAGPSSG